MPYVTLKDYDYIVGVSVVSALYLYPCGSYLPDHPSLFCHLRAGAVQDAIADEAPAVISTISEKRRAFKTCFKKVNENFRARATTKPNIGLRKNRLEFESTRHRA